MSDRSQPRTVTFIHTADWQLGKPFAGIADAAKRARVQQERFEAIRRIAVVVRQRQARFVIVAGDLFDSPTPAHATISAMLGVIAELGVPVLAIPGNHDHAGPDSLWEQPFFQRERARLAPTFQLLATAQPVVVPLLDCGTGADSVTLLPCPLLRRHEADDPTAWIRDVDFTSLGDHPRIVIAHGSTTVFTAGGASRHDDEDDGGGGGTAVNTIAIDRLPLDEIDYIALGDWHGCTAAGPKAWYAGTPEIDRFPKAGQDPGQVACVTVGRGLAPNVATIRTGRFRWIAVDMALEAGPHGAEDNPGAAAVASSGGEVAGGGAEVARGPSHLDAWLAQATRPTGPGEPGFDGCLADLALSGTVSLAGRAELDRVIESWQARLLRLKLTDNVRLAPTAEEIDDLASRPGDPIIARVATELVGRLRAGVAAAATAQGSPPDDDLDVVRLAISILHGLAHPESTATPPAAVTLGAGPR